MRRPIPSQDEDVGDDRFVFAGKHPPGSPHTDRRLIENQQGAVPVAGFAHMLPVSGRRRIDVGASDGLGNDCGHVSFLFEHVFDIAGAAQITNAAVPVRIPQAPIGFAGGTCSVPGSNGPIPLLNSASPPTEMASKEAPWKDSHMDTVLKRPVATRASFSAMPTALVPPGASSTLFKLPGASSPVLPPVRWRAILV
jgi:hypothetical protein